MYSQLLWEHARHPRNQRAMPDALVGTGRYQRCGDKLSLYLRVDDEGRIREASFQARACAPVVAVASLWSQEITGLSIDEARELSILELDRKLGGLPPSKRHAYLIFLECLNRALTTQTNQEKD
mgnify:CR=1 FL=1